MALNNNQQAAINPQAAIHYLSTQYEVVDQRLKKIEESLGNRVSSNADSKVDGSIENRLKKLEASFPSGEAARVKSSTSSTPTEDVGLSQSGRKYLFERNVACLGVAYWVINSSNDLLLSLPTFGSGAASTALIICSYVVLKKVAESELIVNAVVSWVTKFADAEVELLLKLTDQKVTLPFFVVAIAVGAANIFKMDLSSIGSLLTPIIEWITDNWIIQSSYAPHVVGICLALLAIRGIGRYYDYLGCPGVKLIRQLSELVI